jgi:hypothetical protein
MTSHTSWKALFYLITMVNKSGDQNVTSFTGAMDFEASLKEKITRFDQPCGFLLAANKKKEVSILHQPHNFGGTLLRPTNKVGCLTGIGPSAVPVIVDHIAALGSTQAITPPSRTSWAAPRPTASQPSPPPPADGGSLVNLKALLCFIPTPFFHNAILALDSLSPLALIVAARATQRSTSVRM